nr:DUF3265 domain-containing protein [Pseudoalteromonas sp. BDTF-M6]
MVFVDFGVEVPCNNFGIACFTP